jgi:acetoin:2,6-dichlorophenolindophenol oxidoreductase subunit alpha
MTQGVATHPAETLVGIFRSMARIRAIEEKLLAVIETEGFDGLWHPGIGHEGLQVGAVAALRKDDYLFISHRGLGSSVAKGLTLDAIFGDLLGRVTGSTRGKGAGTPHFNDPSIGLYGEGATLGSCFPLAAGAGVSIQLLKQDRVAMAFFGDGASARGTFHEAAIEASVWKLPVVYVCENNGWAISASHAAHSPTEFIADRAAAYGFPGVTVDGQDPMAVYQAAQEAVERARSGAGPSLIECLTLRWRGHWEGDSQRYRPSDNSEFDSRRARDPLEAIRERIPDERATAIEEEERAAVEAAYQRALAAPEPGLEVALSHVWGDS